MMRNIKLAKRNKWGRFIKNSDSVYHSNPHKKKLNFLCEECNKISKKLPWEFKTTSAKRRLCSRKCWREYISKNNPRGKEHWSFKGGKWKNQQGYIELRYWQDGSLIRILEHRKIMEDFLKRKLTDNEIVHHINGIKEDNRIENLQIVLRQFHQGEVCCPYCRKQFAVK